MRASSTGQTFRSGCGIGGGSFLDCDLRLIPDACLTTLSTLTVRRLIRENHSF
jgi:hypothetical protein